MSPSLPRALAAVLVAAFGAGCTCFGVDSALDDYRCDPAGPPCGGGRSCVAVGDAFFCVLGASDGGGAPDSGGAPGDAGGGPDAGDSGAGPSDAATGPDAGPGPDGGCACDDNDPCNGVETCAPGGCVAGVPVDCSPLDEACTFGVCATSGACVIMSRADTTACDDGDPCTLGSACMGGVCVGDPDLDDDTWLDCLGDCDDTLAAVNPASVETGAAGPCTDGLDNDCDLLADISDPGCVAAGSCSAVDCSTCSVGQCCTETTTAGNCLDGCSCAFTCPGGCSNSCAPDSYCSVQCAPGTACDNDCAGRGCDIDCNGASSCSLDCGVGSSCTVECDTGVVCAMGCTTGGMTCPNGWQVCDRACP